MNPLKSITGTIVSGVVISAIVMVIFSDGVTTWFTGAYILAKMGILGAAFTFQPGAAVIGVGAWLGTIMALNVWIFIWPNQKKILGLDGQTHAPEVIARAKVIALMASRTNTVLSIPMLLSMTAYGHGGFPY